MSQIDPTELTVDELKDELEEVEAEEEISDIYEAEKDGDDRKQAKAAIASRKSELGSNDSSTDDDEEDEEDSYSPPSARGNKERLEFDEDPDEEDILAEGPEGAASFDEQDREEGPDGTVYVVGEFFVPTNVSMDDPDAVEDEVGHSISRRLAFAQELVDRSEVDATVAFTDAPDAAAIAVEDDTVTFTEAGIRTGLDRDHKTQWEHLIATQLEDSLDVAYEDSLGLMGDVEYDGVSATLDHFFTADEESEDESSEEEDDEQDEE